MIVSAARHRRAAEKHDEAAVRHEQAAWHWAERGDSEYAELERRNAEIEPPRRSWNAIEPTS